MTKGACSNNRTILREDLERRVLAGLKEQMMMPEVAEGAMRAYAEETNRLNRERRSNGNAWKAELVKIEKQIRGIIEAIKAGMFHPSMKGEMGALEERKAELTKQLTDIPEDVPDLLPSASAVYAKKVAALTAALAKPDERAQAAEALRMLIEKIVLTSGHERGEIYATLHGELRTILEWTERQAIGSATKRNTPGEVRPGVSVSMVAGAGFGLNRTTELLVERGKAPYIELGSAG